MPFFPAYAVCIEEPPAGGRPQSVAHGSSRNELVGRLGMMIAMESKTELIVQSTNADSSSTYNKLKMARVEFF